MKYTKLSDKKMKKSSLSIQFVKILRVNQI